MNADVVLHRATDADGDVEARRDGLARLADLLVVRSPSGVDHRPRGPNRSAERLRQLLDDRELGGLFEPPPPTHDDVSGIEARRSGSLRCGLDERRTLVI